MAQAEVLRNDGFHSSGMYGGEALNTEMWAENPRSHYGPRQRGYANRRKHNAAENKERYSSDYSSYNVDENSHKYDASKSMYKRASTFHGGSDTASRPRQYRHDRQRGGIQERETNRFVRDANGLAANGNDESVDLHGTSDMPRGVPYESAESSLALGANKLSESSRSKKKVTNGGGQRNNVSHEHGDPSNRRDRGSRPTGNTRDVQCYAFDEWSMSSVEQPVDDMGGQEMKQNWRKFQKPHDRRAFNRDSYSRNTHSQHKNFRGHAVIKETGAECEMIRGEEVFVDARSGTGYIDTACAPLISNQRCSYTDTDALSVLVNQNALGVEFNIDVEATVKNDRRLNADEKGGGKKIRNRHGKSRDVQYNREHSQSNDFRVKQYQAATLHDGNEVQESYGRQKMYLTDKGKLVGRGKQRHKEEISPGLGDNVDGGYARNVGDRPPCTTDQADRDGDDVAAVGGAVRNRDHMTKKVVPYQKRNNKSAHEDETQRELLIEQLTASTYECMICCNAVRRDAGIWNCSNCYHIFHLYCIKRWAKSSSAPATEDNVWRCPACQNPTARFPNSYMCFCGKTKDPPFSQYFTPHSCGETCGRQRSKDCPHNCSLQCHPGPCPTCQVYVTRTCSCGRTKQTVRCTSSDAVRCEQPCGKTLNCGRHECKALCHDGPCLPCDYHVTQGCYCGKETRSVVCGSMESFVKSYTCNNVCAQTLDCGNHTCQKVCHEDKCNQCPLEPSLVTHCPCGKTSLVDIPNSKRRKSCTDEIPTCQLTCERHLSCGPKDAPHQCKRRCHTGDCGSCDGTTEITCSCGSSTKELSCKELSAAGEAAYRCDRRCNKKMSCGRHKCGQLCCFNADHVCRLTCGYKLPCGEHKCEETCHRGNCPPCWRVSFEELRCHCGSEVIYPPVPCGTKAPGCVRPCIRETLCGHKVYHPCHSEPDCPPCAMLTKKWCHGRHELRGSIPCYVTDVSCGKPCNKQLSCQVHKCTQTCHKGPCPPCRQPCPAPRETCGHPCGAPCHPSSPCPSLTCKTEITVLCECGRRQERVLCMQGASGENRDAEYTKFAAQSLAARLWEGQSIDIGILKKELKTRKLSCTSECAIFERNQRLALALEIKNPDLSSKLGNPTFTEFLKDQAKLNPNLVATVEKALTEIVLATQQPKVTKKSYSFKSMPSVQRRVIHELAEFYGCQTETYDEEPNKNVVAMAVKDKCWLPNVTLTSLVQRELFPKAPMPIPINHREADLKFAAKAAKQSTQVFSESKSSGQNSTSSKRTGNQTYIDYFDMTD